MGLLCFAFPVLYIPFAKLFMRLSFMCKGAEKFYLEEQEEE
jgi:hypothetical protein